MGYQNNYTIKSRALIYKGELEYLSKCVLDYPDIETGGDLFGFWTYSGYPVIQYVIGPGEKSNHQVAFFNQDIEYLEKIGDALRQMHGLQHIGEWHSHHRLGIAEPSGHDVTTVTSAINNYNLGNFFLVITNIRENSSSINGFMFKKNQGRVFDYTGWVVLEGESPIRNSFDKAFGELVYQPKTSMASIYDMTLVSLKETKYIKLEYASEYWLNEKSNHLALKTIIDDLSKSFQNVTVFQNNANRSIYLQFQYNEHTFDLLFPNGFPLSEPLLRELTGNQEKLIRNDNSLWNPANDIAESTIDFVQSALASKYQTPLKII